MMNKPTFLDPDHLCPRHREVGRDSFVHVTVFVFLPHVAAASPKKMLLNSFASEALDYTLDNKIILFFVTGNT